MNDQPDDGSALEAFVGRTLQGRYRLDAVLGHGGMGVVFRARHLGLGRDVAIKILRPGHEGGMAGARFEREARSASRLDHPSCVRIMDFGELDDGTRFLAMELVDGEELTQRLDRPWAPTAAVDLAIQVLEALRHAHRRGIVHRDLKPDNVLLTTDDEGHLLVKIVDFGIAKLLEEDGAQARLTRTGMRFGTPRYMSPEQAGGGKVDARTDLYAVGLLLYEMLAGRPPFVADDVATMMRLHVLTPPPALPPHVPPTLSAIVMRLLAKVRKQRFDDAEATLDALRAAREALDAPPRHATTHAVAAVIPTPAPTASPSHGVMPSHEIASTAAAITTPQIGARTPWPSTTPVAPPRRSDRRTVVLLGVLAILLVWTAVGIAVAVRDGTETATAPEPAVAPSVHHGGAAPARATIPCAGKACKCKKKEPCDLECVDDCKLSCSGSSACTFVCGEDCEVRCKGASDCFVDVGEDSEVECRGSGACTVSCAGTCEVSCRGSGPCRVQCRDERAPGPRACDDHELACGEC